MDTGFANLVHRGCYDDAHADRERADENRERDIFVFNDLFPQMVRRHLVDDHEGSDEDQDAEHRVKECISKSAEVHVHLPPMYRE